MHSLFERNLEQYTNCLIEATILVHWDKLLPDLCFFVVCNELFVDEGKEWLIWMIIPSLIVRISDNRGSFRNMSQLKEIYCVCMQLFVQTPCTVS